MKRKPQLVLLATALMVPGSVGAADRVQKIHSQTGIQTLEEIPRTIFNVLIDFLPIIATIYLAIAGYRYVVSQGNPDLMEKAKKSLTYAVVGVVIAYSAFLIIRFVGGQLNFGFNL